MDGKHLLKKSLSSGILSSILLLASSLIYGGGLSGRLNVQADSSAFEPIPFFHSEHAAISHDFIWKIENVGDPPVVCGSPSLKLDSRGQPHLSCCNPVSQELKYAYRQAGNWYIVTVASNVRSVGTSLALDREDKPYIAFFRTSDLILARMEGSNWVTDTVAVGSNGFYPSLALDRQQRPHLSYSLGGAIWYAYHQENGWDKTVVQNVGIVNASNSLALDRNDTPHISYYFSYSEDLKYARWNEGEADWELETVATQGNAGFWNSLAVDDQNYPHISYYELTNGDLEYAYRDSQGWHTQPVEQEGRTGHYNALAIDQQNRPHISYLKEMEDGTQMKYAYKEAGEWQVQIVEFVPFTFPLISRVTSLALDSFDRPHISYPGGNLQYAWLGEQLADFPVYLPLILRSP